MFVKPIDIHPVWGLFMGMPSVYLDCNATTPLDPRVRQVLLRYLDEEYGNEGSRTHEYGSAAKRAVQQARDQVAGVVDCKREEVLFTSGATESNNLAILGLVDFGVANNQRHIVSTMIEHKAVLEPLADLETRGFEVTYVKPQADGVVRAADILSALRPDTLLVTVMHVNNETGVIQPIDEISAGMSNHLAYLHVDAAQSFGKIAQALKNQRIDLISISGHKIYAPKGIGALITRRRGYEKVPLKPLMFGGGQERGIRPGTLPVALIAALGEAAALSVTESGKWMERCAFIKEAALKALLPLGGVPVGPDGAVISSTLNIRFPMLDSEALIVGLQGYAAISNGSACTSSSYKPSHVLKAMGMDDVGATRCVRLSWSHLTPDPDWKKIAERIRQLIT
jgi:cysteine desulfurase